MAPVLGADAPFNDHGRRAVLAGGYFAIVSRLRHKKGCRYCPEVLTRAPAVAQRCRLEFSGFFERSAINRARQLSTLLSLTRRWAPQISLIGLLVGEILVLTIAFDTASLERVPSVWAELIGSAPQYLRIAVTVVGLTLLFNCKALLNWIRTSDRGCSGKIADFQRHCCFFPSEPSRSGYSMSFELLHW